MYFRNLKYLMFYFYAFIILCLLNKFLGYILKTKLNIEFKNEKNSLIVTKDWIKSLSKKDFIKECNNYLLQQNYLNILINEKEYADFICYCKEYIIYVKVIYLNKEDVLEDEILKFIGYILRNKINNAIIFTKEDLSLKMVNYIESLNSKDIHITLVSIDELKEKLTKIKEKELLMEVR